MLKIASDLCSFCHLGHYLRKFLLLGIKTIFSRLVQSGCLRPLVFSYALVAIDCLETGNVSTVMQLSNINIRVMLQHRLMSIIGLPYDHSDLPSRESCPAIPFSAIGLSVRMSICRSIDDVVFSSVSWYLVAMKCLDKSS